MGHTEVAEQIMAEAEDQTCDHIGPYLKDGDFEVQIEALFIEHGMHMNDDGNLVYNEEDEGKD